jgi:hypothetical protein
VRYFCLTHVPIPWRLPSFMEPVSTVPAGEGILDLGQRYPQFAGRGPVLSEYGTLFALRRMLQASWEGGRPPAEDLFRPPEGTLLLPAPASFGMPLVTQYARAHHVRDLLQFMACAIDLGVVEDTAVGQFLGHDTMLVSPSVGIYPAGWLMDTLEKLEAVATAFEDGFAVPHEGYQNRAVGFCLERLHAMLAAGLIPTWPKEKVCLSPAIIVTDQERYGDGG